jgi:hypothetical protein
MNTWRPMEAAPSFSMICIRRLGGTPDLRVPCVFGQRLNGYHPFEGTIVVWYFALALVQAPRWGRILCVRPASRQVCCSMSKDAAPPRSGPLEAATVQTPHVECCQARAYPSLRCHSKEARASPSGAHVGRVVSASPRRRTPPTPPNTYFAHHR